jgi:hypothetical protein
VVAEEVAEAKPDVDTDHEQESNRHTAHSAVPPRPAATSRLVGQIDARRLRLN